MKTIYFILVLLFLIPELPAQVLSVNASSGSEIILKTSSGDISGTLTLPENKGPFPVLLIIAGSGPTDRDGNSIMGVQTNAYKMLAETLTQKGIATLRFDKRGIGRSKSSMKSESELRFETYIEDVVEWIKLLKSDKRFSSVYIAGHSEGSLIGMIASEQTNVAGYISIAGAGKSADKILQEQLRTKLTPQLIDESNKILESLRAGKTVSEVNSALISLYRQSVQPYMISWIKYDPEKEIAKLTMPVLIIQGTTDLQVTVDDGRLLSNANPKAKLLIIERMNHVLKESDANAQQNMATYRNPALPLKPELVNAIVEFVKK